MIESARESVSAATVSGVYGGRTARQDRASFGPVADLIGRVAETDVTVLIRGEHGTGKELVARAIHSSSPRHEHPFIKIDCASLSQALEAELFGCERGAVAGAGQHRPGRLEFAHHGTLFLDHVNELPAALQLRLQRVLEEGGFARAGAREAVPADVRVIASSEPDLERAVVEGRFREALFFRLNVVCLTLSPLRQRRPELRELAEFFIRQHSIHYNKPAIALSPEAFRMLNEYDWPGNLHELDAVIKRLVMLGNGTTVRQELARSMRDDDDRIGEIPSARETSPRPDTVPHPPGSTDTGAAAATPLKEIARQAADGAERELILKTLQRTRWNRREAAQRLGVSYKALLYKIKRAELDGGP